MDEDYKGHHIQSVPRHLLPDSERWTAQVLINWTDGRRKQFRRFDVKRGFATEEEAELAGLTFARKWIDDGKPKLRESGTGSSLMSDRWLQLAELSKLFGLSEESIKRLAKSHRFPLRRLTPDGSALAVQNCQLLSIL